MAKVKTVSLSHGMILGLARFPNFHKSGNVWGMKKLYYGKHALLIRCGDFIYNVSSEASIYYGI